MSISTQISRIQADRNTIRSKLVELGLATSTDNLDVLATAIAGIVNKGAIKVEVKEGETYNIPAGYHDGSGTVAGVRGGGNYTLQSKSVTPTKVQQVASSDEGYYGLSSVTVAPIPDAYQDVTSVTAEEEDVLVGKVFVDSEGNVLAGTMTNNGSVTQTLSVTTISYTIPKGYHDGGGKVTITLETKTVTPTESKQEITPTAGKVLSKVTVNPIPVQYADTTPTTAVADDVLYGKKVVLPKKDASGNITGTEIVEGIMPNVGAVAETLNVSKKSYTVPQGYHDGTGKVEITTEEKTATPTKNFQSIAPSSGNVLSKVTVNPIPDEYQDVSEVDAEAMHVFEGYKFVDSEGNVVTGIMTDNGGWSKTLIPAYSSTTIPIGYHHGHGTVKVLSEDLTVTPTKETQTKSSPANYYGTVTVNPIPEKYQDVTPVDVIDDEVLSGKKFVNSSGEVVTGTMPNKGAITKTIDGLSETSYTIPAGYHNGSGTVSLTSDIEDQLAAI